MAGLREEQTEVACGTGGSIACRRSCSPAVCASCTCTAPTCSSSMCVGASCWPSRCLVTASLLFIHVVLATAGVRRQYPLPHHHQQRRPLAYEDGVGVGTMHQPTLHYANRLAIDAITGFAYNPHTKQHPGRHVCSSQRNVTHPVQTMHPYCKPVFKHVAVSCGENQICTGVRKEYQTDYRPVTTSRNVEEVTYFCCPGWERDGRTHGCIKPVCSKPCLNGGVCVKPNTCRCPQGFAGDHCSENINYAAEGCTPPCQNDGRCVGKEQCECSRGFTGSRCEQDVDECRQLKPCDHICYNTHGSFACHCKENFLLQPDGQTCREEDYDDTQIEGRPHEFESLDKRLVRLETMMNNSHNIEATQSDIDNIHKDMDHISHDVLNLKNSVADMNVYRKDLYAFRNRLYQIEQKAFKIDDLIRKYERMKKCAFHNKICI